jgi:hypothetical protein
LLIPKELLGESQEVKLIQQEGQIILPGPRQTSIWDLGKNPVECEVKDGAIPPRPLPLRTMNKSYFLDTSYIIALE